MYIKFCFIARKRKKETLDHTLTRGYTKERGKIYTKGINGMESK
jgi:hypothetical protein